MELRELGWRVKLRRAELGLTQGQLAKLSELSRTTINHLESGVLQDLGYVKLNHLLAILGLNLDAKTRFQKTPALEIAARTASTSYKRILSSDELAQILGKGCIPDFFKPHMMTLLDETPIPLVVSAAHEASIEMNVPAKKIMKHIAQFAEDLHTYRKVW